MSLKWDQRKLDELVTVQLAMTQRNSALVVNSHLYHIALGAIANTPKALESSIRGSLGGLVSVSRLTKKGKTVNRRKLQLVSGGRVNAPLAALIINKKRAADGKPGLYGAEMERAIRKMLAARVRSRAFLKAGWLPAVQDFGRAVKKATRAPESDVRTRGQPKGDAKPAKSEWTPMGEMWNRATTRHDDKGALHKIAGPALDQAWMTETNQLIEHLRERIQEQANQFNSQQGGPGHG